MKVYLAFDQGPLHGLYTTLKVAEALDIPLLTFWFDDGYYAPVEVDGSLTVTPGGRLILHWTEK